MGWRYRRSVKVAPGVKLNFSKSGISTTLGPKGAHYTIGRKGRRTITAGTPIKGLYVSTTYNKNTIKRQKRAAKEQKRLARLEKFRANYNPNRDGFKRSEWTNHLPCRKRNTVLALCIFLGFFGVHRFYVGKEGTGLVYLITLGLLGVGWLVDIVLILLGKFKDIQGRELTR
ncbi:DUF4236 domain-containing protein [Candidatus Saccharibacteria bacterium]|nr:DUF4236 domain-containing protein [Candidatus Saccharibacteria bacterium]